MFRSYLIQHSLVCMDASAKRRENAVRMNQVDGYRQDIRSAVQNFYGKLPVGKNGLPVNVSPVSTFTKNGFKIENILFESFPGWQVNATVFVPQDFDPPFPAVIVPVGHSGKQYDNYQLPCQYFARSGYLAITFDPPGQSGEKQPGNDHFVDGVRCYPIGETSSQYFIADALRCVDYLESRRDVDPSRGFAITGVSGGGTTTLFAGLLDERLTVLGPSCCVTPLADLDITQCYAGCPETRMWRRYAEGIDEIDLICAAAPKPILLMAGKADTVFRIEDTTRLAGEARDFYTQIEIEDHFSYYIDSGGHGYSLDQARQFVAFMDHWLRATPPPGRVAFPDTTILPVPYAELQCHPQTEINMRTLASQKAGELRLHRSMDPTHIRQSAARLVGQAVLPPIPTTEISQPFRVWHHQWQQVMLYPEPGIELPATFLYNAANTPAPTLLHFDDRGRHAAVEQNGLLVRAVRFLEEDGVNLFTVDLRGWGDTTPALYPFELPWWGARDRFFAYISTALGDPVMAMRVRDGLAALAYLRLRPECDSSAVVLSGYGLGGVVALHVAAIAANVAGVVIWESPFSLEWLIAEPQYTWPADLFIPNMLLSYDFPELAGSLPGSVSICNPLDARRQLMSDETLAALHSRCGERTNLANASPESIIARIQGLLKRYQH